MRNHYWLFFSLFLVACATQKASKTALTPPVFEKRTLDTLVVEPTDDEPDVERPESATDDIPITLPAYSPSYKRTNDLLHTKLDVRFNWEKEEVIGKASLKFKPLFYPVSSLTLDAKGFELKKVALQTASGEQSLKYTYDSSHLVINLGKTYTRTEEYTINIDYIARPKSTGGSSAITSNQGLFFINPRKEDGDKPQQIWTQGETEWNSRWFPTIDEPNERSTEEIYITVDKKFVTLSNGLLTSSTNNPDGTRTDYWKMDQAHPPYLFMLAVGEFAVVKEKWRNIELSYYVEPAYKDDARDIFAHTPEMLEFFSTKLGVVYPWPKFAQITVRDYVSGAMENTTAVIFGENEQKHKRELIDNPNDRVVAHEMFHHWFGDYVTTESWPNLTLNEGFANYSEYLWYQHKYGNDEADHHLQTEWEGYFNQASTTVHPLIYFGYKDKEVMFDAHSYNKGGSVLHMLRTYLGDDAFFTALNRYLTKNAGTAVEIHQLRLAFEEVTGEDLNWFFNQWYLSAGHPELTVATSYDASTKEVTLQVTQTQEPNEGVPAIFQLPVNVDVYEGGDKKRHAIFVNQRDQVFRFPAATEPDLINFDGDHALLAIVQQDKTNEALAFQFTHAPKYLDRYEAIDRLVAAESELTPDVLKKALKDPSWVIRNLAIQNLPEETDEETTQALRNIAKGDVHSEVRSAALDHLSSQGDSIVVEIAKKLVETDQAYPVIASALQIINDNDGDEGLVYAQKLEGQNNAAIDAAVGAIYQETGDPKYLPFFQKKLATVDGMEAVSLYESFVTLVGKAGDNEINAAVTTLKTIAKDNRQSLYRRFAATKSIFDLRNSLRSKGTKATNAADKEKFKAKATELTDILIDIKKTESNPELKSVYERIN
jgi:aminopeptidase N